VKKFNSLNIKYLWTKIFTYEIFDFLKNAPKTYCESIYNSQVLMSEQLTLFSLPEPVKEPKNHESYKGKPRLNSPFRSQIEFINASLDDLIPEDHKVRNIWNYIDQMDLSPILVKIQSTVGNAGRPAIDPKLLLALWVYAIVEGIGSARVIDRYCSEHIAFKWLCGGVSVNYHTISDFRRNNSKEFDELISEIVARLMHRGLVDLNRVSQDGMRVRASASSSSFRRKQTLKDHLYIAKKQVELLRKELDEDSSICLNRQAASKIRAAEDRLKRVKEAVDEHRKSVAEITNAKKKQRKSCPKEKIDQVRASTTDPQARKMKMSNGGFNPAYNFQAAVDTKSRFIVGHYVTNKNHDFDELIPMFNIIKNKCGKIAGEWLVDQGYLDHNNIIQVQKKGCKVYVHPRQKGKQSPNIPRQGEHCELVEWRIRMGMEEAKEVYKDRAATSEWVNAGMRNRGLKNLLVRGINAVSSVLSLHVLTHNILRANKLGFAW
jgi:transposase